METAQAWVMKLYAAFNRRDAEAVLERMAEDVSWPTASEGGRVVGKDAIRAYWSRQWAEFDPRVEPEEIREDADGRVAVEVHQVVRDRAGAVLLDGRVQHVYTLRDGLIARMELGEPPAAWHR